MLWTTMVKRAAVIASGLTAIFSADTIAQTLAPNPVFEAETTAVARNGATQPVHVNVQSWGLAGLNGRAQKIPLRGFYLAHLLSGSILSTIDGQPMPRAPGDYWPVKSGATMQVKVRGEFAVLETIVVTKQ